MISVDHRGALPERDHLSQRGTACWETTEDQLCSRFERKRAQIHFFRFVPDILIDLFCLEWTSIWNEKNQSMFLLLELQLQTSSSEQ